MAAEGAGAPGGVPGAGGVHTPVLYEPVLDAVERWLGASPGGLFVDGTAGSGHHAEGVLTRQPGLRLLGLDWDPDSLAVAAEQLEPFGERAQLRRSALSELDANL